MSNNMFSGTIRKFEKGFKITLINDDGSDGPEFKVDEIYVESKVMREWYDYTKSGKNIYHPEIERQF